MAYMRTSSLKMMAPMMKLMMVQTRVLMVDSWWVGGALDTTPTLRDHQGEPTGHVRGIDM